MPGNSELKVLVEQFANQLETIVEGRANAAFAAKFDSVRQQLVGQTAPNHTRVVAPVQARRVGRPPGSRSSYAAAAKPCPVCGTPNKSRRSSYLCESHATAENLAKFKGASRNVAPIAAPSPVKRGPGRPAKLAPAQAQA